MAIDLTDGRPWVLVPGTLCTQAVFDPLLDLLGVPRSVRRVVPLRSAALESYVADLNRLAERDAVVCAFSLGAIVTAHLADQLAAAQILLFGLNPHADDPAKHEGRRALEHDVARLGGRAALDLRLPPFAGPDPAGVRRLVLDMAEQSAPDIAAQTTLALDRPGALAALGRTRSEVFFLTGTEDTQAPLAQARAAMQATPRGRLIPLAGLGHYAMLEDPAACSRALAAGLTPPSET